MNEREVLNRVRAIFDQTPNLPELLIPNGDDGAVFKVKDSQIVVSTDISVEDVHFRSNWSSAEEIGTKITAANLADICAMGGWPKYLLVSVAFPSHFLVRLEDLAKGIYSECKKVGAKVIGGDLSSSEKLIISITAIGETNAAVSRSGAKANDYVLISNLTGWSAAGLLALENSFVSTLLAQKAIKLHCAPQIDYEKYQSCFSKVNSATDTSDGLLIDAANIADSSGLAFELESRLIQEITDFHELQELAAQIIHASKENLDHSEIVMNWILRGGEDHVLLVTGPEPIAGFSVIGRALSGSGVYLDGKKVASNEGGFQHRW